jgi:release factor glutamine methyltransferase
MDDVVTRLRAAGCVFAEDEAEALRSTAGSDDELEAMVRRRVAGEPLEHVVGWVEFGGLRLAVQPGVFVPRPRTELLARTAASLARGGEVVVDLCCGVGAIAAVVAATVTGVELHAADVDPAALACARANLSGRGLVHAGDLFGALPGSLRGRIRVLVANVPYVPTGAISLMPAEARLHEPRTALDGGPDGLDVLRRLLGEARAWVAVGGHVLVECSRDQTSAAVAAFHSAGLGARVVHDDELDATVVVGQTVSSSQVSGGS